MVYPFELDATVRVGEIPERMRELVEGGRGGVAGEDEAADDAERCRTEHVQDGSVVGGFVGGEAFGFGGERWRFCHGGGKYGKPRVQNNERSW